MFIMFRTQGVLIKSLTYKKGGFCVAENNEGAEGRET